MPCFSMLRAWQKGKGSKPVFSPYPRYTPIQLPCGQCVGCRYDRAKMWANRCIHESTLHSSNCFITLTYSDEHLPQYNSLYYPHFSKFLKRLRKRYSGTTVRFFMCGEYGDLNWRPHYHALLFGICFNDLKLWQRTKSNELIYRSSILESLWPFGHSSVGVLTLKSAGYVARYNIKKINGDLAESHYERFDQVTGEVYNLVPEFCQMSRKPGIGSDYFHKYKSSIYSVDAIVSKDGRRDRVPRYYDKLMKDIDGDTFDLIQSNRLQRIADLYSALPEDQVFDSKSEYIFREKVRPLKRNL
ncbi:MAG: replication initiator protein [Microvirus sp.]|nr:MAG: replication initiator protein [Microvirus sp.]